MIFSETTYSEAPFSGSADTTGWNGELFTFTLNIRPQYNFDLYLIT